MEEHGTRLAAAHKLTLRRGPNELLPRLAVNETVVVDACEVPTAAARTDRRITPAGEWLLDGSVPAVSDEGIATSAGGDTAMHTTGIISVRGGP